MHLWLSAPPASAVISSLQRMATLDDVDHLAVMPDVHLAGDVCIGTVVATRSWLLPAAVGGDIGCGMAAVAFDASSGLLADEMAAARVLQGLYHCVPANRHPTRSLAECLPAELAQVPLSDSQLDRFSLRDGRAQLGTLGRGNHFVEFQSDSENRLWLMLHSGSRAMGQSITAHHQRHAERLPNGLSGLRADSNDGRNYLNDMAWALLYAETNRLAMVRAVGSLMQDLFDVQIDWSTLIHSHHNHVRLEEHFGKPLWVHRKGALSARDGEAGVIPGSMGTRSFHVLGQGCRESLQSSSHGAGRVMSRHDAQRQIRAKQFEREMRGVWFDRRISGKLRDEAPSAYKDIGKVMRAQKDLTRIVRALHPVLCYKTS